MRTLKILIGVFVLALLLACCTTIGTILHKYDYQELRPAQTTYGPGVILAVREKGDAIMADMVCKVEEALGSPAPQPTESPGPETDFIKDLSGTVAIDADLLNRIKADANLKLVENVEFHFANVHFFEIPDTAITANSGKITPACLKAISYRLQQKAIVAVVKRVLKADVIGVVTFQAKASVDAQAPQQLLNGVAAKLGMEVDASSANTIKGAGLYWGIKVEPNLVPLFPGLPDAAGGLLAKAGEVEADLVESVSLPAAQRLAAELLGRPATDKSEIRTLLRASSTNQQTKYYSGLVKARLEEQAKAKLPKYIMIAPPAK
jgi:hypothetical protein